MSEDKEQFVAGGVIRPSAFRAMPSEEIVALPVAEKFREYERRIEELEDHYRGAREIIQGERLRREEAERVSLSVQQRANELEGQVESLGNQNQRFSEQLDDLQEIIIRLRDVLSDAHGVISEGGLALALHAGDTPAVMQMCEVRDRIDALLEETEPDE